MSSYEKTLCEGDALWYPSLMEKPCKRCDGSGWSIPAYKPNQPMQMCRDCRGMGITGARFTAHRLRNTNNYADSQVWHLLPANLTIGSSLCGLSPTKDIRWTLFPEPQSAVTCMACCKEAARRTDSAPPVPAEDKAPKAAS